MKPSERKRRHKRNPYVFERVGDLMQSFEKLEPKKDDKGETVHNEHAYTVLKRIKRLCELVEQQPELIHQLSLFDSFEIEDSAELLTDASWWIPSRREFSRALDLSKLFIKKFATGKVKFEEYYHSRYKSDKSKLLSKWCSGLTEVTNGVVEGDDISQYGIVEFEFSNILASTPLFSKYYNKKLNQWVVSNPSQPEKVWIHSEDKKVDVPSFVSPIVSRDCTFVFHKFLAAISQNSG